MILVICSLCNFLGFLSAGSVCGRFQRIFAQAAQLVLAKLFGRFSVLAAEFVVCVTAAARLKFHPKISLAAVADTAPRLALRKNQPNSPRSLGAFVFTALAQTSNDCASLGILEFQIRIPKLEFQSRIPKRNSQTKIPQNSPLRGFGKRERAISFIKP